MNKIIAITGPTGAGKSTTAKLLCKKFERCVRLDIDRVKHFVETGFVYNDTPRGVEQWALCVKNVIQLTKNFQAEGYTVIIEGYIDLESPGWEDVFRELDVDAAFLLLCDEKEQQDRNMMRKPEARMEPEDIGRHLEYFLPRRENDMFVVKDSTGETAEETVDWIYDKI